MRLGAVTVPVACVCCMHRIVCQRACVPAWRHTDSAPPAAMCLVAALPSAQVVLTVLVPQRSVRGVHVTSVGRLHQPPRNWHTDKVCDGRAGSAPRTQQCPAACTAALQAEAARLAVLVGEVEEVLAGRLQHLLEPQEHARVALVHLLEHRAQDDDILHRLVL